MEFGKSWEQLGGKQKISSQLDQLSLQKKTVAFFNAKDHFMVVQRAKLKTDWDGFLQDRIWIQPFDCMPLGLSSRFMLVQKQKK